MKITVVTACCNSAALVEQHYRPEAATELLVRTYNVLGTASADCQGNQGLPS